MTLMTSVNLTERADEPELFHGDGKILGKYSVSPRSIVKVIAALDIFYAMLLIALHLLSLITRRSIRKGQFSVLPTALATGEGDLEVTTTQSPEIQYSAQKTRETAEVLLWVVMFALCILQLLVAGALYGGTKQKEGRICVRNCRIWVYCSSFLILVILIQMTVSVIEGKAKEEMLRHTVLGLEIVLRLTGIAAIHHLNKEIKNEQCDPELNENDTIYYELQQTSPSPSPNKGTVRGSGRRPSKRHYHRTEVWDDLDFAQV